tara:strand:+ start:231 stop:527 length:297 start_codon:yes stop_codon:yes gene_type:complete
MSKLIPTYIEQALRIEQLERELVAARAELVETKKELNDKNKFCYAVEQALDGLKGDYVEIILALRTDAERYRYIRSTFYHLPDEKFNDAIDAAMKEAQ